MKKLGGENIAAQEEDDDDDDDKDAEEEEEVDDRHILPTYVCDVYDFELCF